MHLRASALALAAALALAPAPARAAFTAGNLLVSLAGNGTSAGSPNGTLAQSLCAFSFEEFAASGAGLASTLQTAAAPSAGASAFTTLGNAADPGGSTNAPFSGSLAISSDGYFVTFVGYGAPAGTFVGASNAGVGDTQTNNVIVAPPASASRLIGYIDYSGLVSFVQGNLNAISTMPSVAYNMDAWGAVWCASCSSFYVTVGPYIGTTGGGIFYIPMALGISGPMGTPVQLATSPPTSAANNLKGYTAIGIYSGNVYVARSGNGVSGGTNPLTSPGQPALPTTAAQVPLGTGNLPPVVGNVAAGISSTTLGSHLPHAFLFTGSGATLTFWQSDPVFGLLSVPSCNATAAGIPVTCGAATVPAGTYTTFPPGPSFAGLNARIMGIALATVSGAQVIVVLQVDAMWLWPVANTGSYVSAAGSCCATPSAGACCWANGGAPIAPRAGFQFRYVAPVPAQPPCSLAGYYCPASLPVPCPAGSACAGGAAPAQCSPNFYALAGATACLPCPSGLSTTAPGATSAAACVPCAANFVPATLPSSGSTSPGCVACAPGQTSVPGSASCANPNAGAFTPGNLLVFMAGDGSVAGSAMPSTPKANDRNSISAVAGQILEYSVSTSGALTPTGVTAVLPATGAGTPPSGPITVLGNVADIGNNGNGTSYQPFSGQLSTSTDGTIISFVGYSQAAGALVGASCMCNGAVPASNNNVGLSISVPPPTVKRVIGWFDASGVVRIVNGDLNSVLGGVPINSALWYANGAGGSGFFVTGGNTGATAASAVGGIYFVPMAQGIGGPMGAPVLICLNPSYTASKWVHAHAHAHRSRAIAQVCTQAAAP